MLRCCYKAEFTDPAFASVMPGIVDTPMTAAIRETSNNMMSSKVLAFHKKLHHDCHLIKPETVALFLAWLLLDLKKEEFAAKEWDIYDKTHHKNWLKGEHKIFPI